MIHQRDTDGLNKCFWTTPNLHWKDSECKNFASGIQISSEDHAHHKSNEKYCLQKCEETKGCNEFEHKTGPTKGSCKLYKAVTFDERCTRLTPGSAGW
jgi:hypothetical protein